MKKEKKIEEIELPIGWIIRLQDYIDRVRNTGDDDDAFRIAVIALLGYLESLVRLKSALE